MISIITDDDRVRLLNLMDDYAAARVNMHLAAARKDERTLHAQDARSLQVKREINYRLGGEKPTS